MPELYRIFFLWSSTPRRSSGPVRAMVPGPARAPPVEAKWRAIAVTWPRGQTRRPVAKTLHFGFRCRENATAFLKSVEPWSAPPAGLQSLLGRAAPSQLPTVEALSGFPRRAARPDRTTSEQIPDPLLIPSPCDGVCLLSRFRDTRCCRTRLKRERRMCRRHSPVGPVVEAGFELPTIVASTGRAG